MINGKSDYSKLLFQKYPFVFVGSIQSFHRHYTILNNQHKRSFKSNLDVSISDFWENSRESNELMDAKKVLKYQYYATEKGAKFLELHKMYNSILVK